MRLSVGWWIVLTVLALAAIVVGIGLLSRIGTDENHEYLCWDTPSTGSPAKYVVTFDAGTRVEVATECVRVPATLHSGNHVAVVQAVDAYGQLSPPATLKFVVP
jgi:hypothetical protein